MTSGDRQRQQQIIDALTAALPLADRLRVTAEQQARDAAALSAALAVAVERATALRPRPNGGIKS